MINAQTMRKGSFLVAVTSLVFTIVAAFINYLYLDMTVIGAPSNYFAFFVLIAVLPYLFVGVIALIITMIAGNLVQSQQQDMPPPPISEPQ